jgi:ABC-type transport system involved in cytochrome c biogenesis permease component
MRSFTALLRHEIIIQNRVLHILRYHMQFSILSLICLIFLIPNKEDMAELGLIFLNLILPLAVISTSRGIIKEDIVDGTMSMLMITTSTSRIICVKFLALFLNNVVALIILMPLIVVFYSLSFDQAMMSIISRITLLAQISSTTILIGCIEGYFRSGTDFISSLLLPITIPGICVSGLMIYCVEKAQLYIGILCGIDLVTMPIILLLSGYLLKNVYN